VISGQHIITPAGDFGAGVICVNDEGRIASIEPSNGAVPSRTLVAGFVDLQVNGIDDIDVAHADGADWDRLSELLLAQGTTTWCPTLVTAPLDRYAARLERIDRAMAAQRADQAHILGVHLEGPFLGGAPGAHPRQYVIPVNFEWLAALPRSVRLVTLAAENPGAAEATRLLCERGVLVAIGHSTPSDEQAAACFAAGARMVTHLFNGMSGVHHRTDGLALLALTEPDVVAGLIADGVHVSDRALGLAVAAKGADCLALVTDAVGWRHGSAGEVRLRMVDGAPRLSNGILAGSALTMDAAVRRLVNDVRGCSLTAAVKMASETPARLIGEPDRGRLSVGARADVVALDEHLSVSEVWLSGSQVR
jgi:N-acetylglucosamine-6-phosphate deacetylase